MKLIDLSGLHCPLPILKTKQALQMMVTGELLEVVATDPHSEVDFKVFLEKSGHELLQFSKNDGCFVFLIKKN